MHFNAQDSGRHQPRCRFGGARGRRVQGRPLLLPERACRCTCPPLREHREDVPELLAYHMESFASQGEPRPTGASRWARRTVCATTSGRGTSSSSRTSSIAFSFWESGADIDQSGSGGGARRHPRSGHAEAIRAEGVRSVPSRRRASSSSGSTCCTISTPLAATSARWPRKVGHGTNAPLPQAQVVRNRAQAFPVETVSDGR